MGSCTCISPQFLAPIKDDVAWGFASWVYFTCSVCMLSTRGRGRIQVCYLGRV
jgi:hypothetical protein